MPRKTGRPKAEEVEDDDEGSIQPDSAFDTPDLDSFLRDLHGESAESAAESGHGEDVDKLPGLGWIREHFKTKSAAIRYLVIDRKFPVAKVAKHLNLRYQHVRNVSRQQLKRGPNEDFHLAEGQKATTVKSDD